MPENLKPYTPRVRTISGNANTGWYRYRGYDIHIDRKERADNWYIQVRHPDGGFVYDGWWRDSDYKPKREALHQAIRGAGLWPGHG